ncbi:MAG: NAD-dependent epimerase/dehydratase family protein [Candidatus Paceibacterota bacterium]
MIKNEILKSFASKNVLVTGGTGMIGRQVVNILADAGANIRIISLDKLKVNDKAEHVFGDLTDFNFCKEVSKDMDFVFQVAGIQGTAETSKTKIASHFIPNLMMNVNVLEAARINKAKKVVFTSSIGIYPQAEIFRESDYRIDSVPMDFAAWGKRMAELQVYAYKVQYNLENFSIVVPSHVYGPGDNFDPQNALVIPSLMHKIFRKDNPVIVWGDGSAIRDFVFSKDVAEGIILALYHGTKSDIVNLGSGQGTSIKELVETLHGFLDFNYKFDFARPSGFPKRVMDISLAKNLLGYNPATSLADGLKETWHWFINNRDEYLMKKNYFIED